MFALLLAAALVGHADAGAELLPIHGQADTIELHHQYDAKGVYVMSNLVGYDTDGIAIWEQTVHWPPFWDAVWPECIAPGLVRWHGRNYRARLVRERWGPRLRGQNELFVPSAPTGLLVPGR